MNSSTALDISSELESIAKADEIAVKLAERKKEREQEAKSSVAKEQRESTEVEQEQMRQQREAKAEAARKKEEAKLKREQEQRRKTADEKEQLRQKQNELNWVTPGFKIDSAKSEQIDRIFYKMKLDGVGYKHKQLLVDEAMSWLVEKHKRYL